MPADPALPCPLCGDLWSSACARAQGREYHRCPTCALVFLDPTQRPRPAEERARYLQHHNDLSDAGYRRWLSRLADPICARVERGACGLDFGSGPVPALAELLRSRGFPTETWDPFFANDGEALRRRYDFVVACETVEHFHAPLAAMTEIDALVRPGGWVGLMTGILTPGRDFATWPYVRDSTHVCFWSEPTMAWLAGHFGWRVEVTGDLVFLFQKPQHG